MKKWRCTVCGYIHTGDAPPETCPVCGAPSSAFVEYLESDEKEQQQTELKNAEDVFTDIIIVGSGAAALSAAVTAVDEGQNVIVLEKGSNYGGTTRRSGGRYWVANNYAQRELGVRDNMEDAIAYMARYSYPARFNKNLKNYGLTDYEYGLIESYYDNASLVIDFMKEKGVFESAVDMSWTGSPHIDYMENIPENKSIGGRSIYAVTEKGPAVSGNDLIELFLNWLNKRNVDMRLNHRVVDAITNDKNEVVGVVVETKETRQKFYAKKGVIFGSGGFSHNKDMIKRFHSNPLLGGCAVPENTGDFVSIAEKVGAMLGNMSGAYRLQSLYESYLENPDGANSTFYYIGDSFIEVNKYGKRAVDEKRNYNDRAKIHYAWDPIKGEYPNQFMFFITDKRVMEYWGGFPPYPESNPEKASYVITGKDMKDLANQIEKRLDKIKDHIGNFELDSNFYENLVETVARFNEFAKAGKDDDFHRGETKYDLEYASLPPFKDVKWPSEGQKNNSMYPIADEGPYYAIILAPGSLDTNGGPMTNKNAQVLDNEYKPIEGLYGAGNCIASAGIDAYWGAGATIGPAMTNGYLAAKHASKSENKNK